MGDLVDEHVLLDGVINAGRARGGLQALRELEAGVLRVAGRLSFPAADSAWSQAGDSTTADSTTQTTTRVGEAGLSCVRFSSEWPRVMPGPEPELALPVCADAEFKGGVMVPLITLITRTILITLKTLITRITLVTLIT